MTAILEVAALAFLQVGAAETAEDAEAVAVEIDAVEAMAEEAANFYDPATPRKPNQRVEPDSIYASWVRSSDYPKAARNEKRSGTTAIRMTVSETGEVEGCTITQSSGHADLDQAACESVTRRARFIPATNADAGPIRSSYEHRVVWTIYEEEESATSAAIAAEADAAADAAAQGAVEAAEAMADGEYFPGKMAMDLPQAPKIRAGEWSFRGLNDYPQGALERKSMGQVRVALSVDAEGNVTNCQIVEPADDADLNAASCLGAEDLTVTSPALDIDGNPTPGRVGSTVFWWLPEEETVVLSRREYWRPTPRLPFLESGMLGAAIEAKADGTVISCEILKEGDLPPAFGEFDKICEDVRRTGVYFISGFPTKPSDLRNAELDPLGAKVRVEVRLRGERVDNADKPIETVED